MTILNVPNSALIPAKGITVDIMTAYRLLALGFWHAK
jgi:hypothetical protein